MLVPDLEFEVARDAARGRIEVRSVSTFEEALDALEDIGGDPVPDALALPAGALPEG